MKTSPPLATVTLRRDKEYSLLSGHPWVYRDSLKDVPGTLQTGSPVEVLSARGRRLGLGLADITSPILVRLIPGEPEQNIEQRIVSRLRSSVRLRQSFFDDTITNAYRLINGEGDGLGGLIVERYAETLCLQVYSLAWEPYLPLIQQELTALLPKIRWIWRRNHVRRAESAQGDEILFGKDFPGVISFRENGLKFRADLVRGQKTGFFLDQRENRRLIRTIAKGRRVANVCGYTGAFSVYALAGGATATVTVDSAAPALAETVEHLRLNALDEAKNTNIVADMYDFLGSPEAAGFDLLIVDPPSMAKARKDLPKAVNAYRRLNALAMKALGPNGLLFSASCSSQVSPDDFRNAVANAAVDAGKTVRLLSETHHGLDHPIALGHLEGRYLHGLLMEIQPL